MRFLLPEIASPISFCVTLILFLFFSITVAGVFRKEKKFFSEVEALPLQDD